ncbi:hypothetical protein DERF_013457 [Dermatophagoides farinae]|uniref:Uncharacterized protein n=1 Tax=Dermatophagoides farinae TaxID=6954 RepID=A0A922HR72_DERFA|nr:hypothetical protein DERF_013457 [Dermatophagoides farinae]
MKKRAIQINVIISPNEKHHQFFAYQIIVGENLNTFDYANYIGSINNNNRSISEKENYNEIEEKRQKNLNRNHYYYVTSMNWNH